MIASRSVAFGAIVRGFWRLLISTSTAIACGLAVWISELHFLYATRARISQVGAIDVYLLALTLLPLVAALVSWVYVFSARSGPPFLHRFGVCSALVGAAIGRIGVLLARSPHLPHQGKITPAGDVGEVMGRIAILLVGSLFFAVGCICILAAVWWRLRIRRATQGPSLSAA